jgi:hypothetical protein
LPLTLKDRNARVLSTTIIERVANVATGCRAPLICVDDKTMTKQQIRSMCRVRYVPKAHHKAMRLNEKLEIYLLGHGQCIIDLDTGQIAGAKLSVYYQVEKGKLPNIRSDLQSRSHRPKLFRFERLLLANDLAFVPCRHRGGHDATLRTTSLDASETRIELNEAHWQELQIRLHEAATCALRQQRTSTLQAPSFVARCRVSMGALVLAF